MREFVHECPLIVGEMLVGTILFDARGACYAYKEVAIIRLNNGACFDFPGSTAKVCVRTSCEYVERDAVSQSVGVRSCCQLNKRPAHVVK